MTDTLKSICEQCTNLQNPQLDFVPVGSERQREIILRDLAELVSAAGLEREKTVVILAGCVFESVLYLFIQEQVGFISARRGVEFAFDPEQSLDNYVSIFNRYFSDLMSIPDLVVNYRDLVHINRELQYPPGTCRAAAPEMLRLLDALVETLEAYSRE